MGGKGVGLPRIGFGLCFGVLGRCGGLFVGFAEGAPEDARACQDDLEDYSMRLGRVVLVLNW